MITEKQITEWLNTYMRTYRLTPIDENERILIDDVLRAIEALKQTKG